MLNIYRCGLAIALLALCACSWLPAQDKQNNPDRPPGAQKKKSDKSKPAQSPGSTQPQSAPQPQADPPAVSHPPVEPGDSPGETSASNAPADATQATGKQRKRIRVDVNLGTSLASVLDENNGPAPDLPVEAFQVFEEGVQQKIEFFEAETKQPVDIALMIDTSMSTHKEFAFGQEAAAHFIRQVLRPGDGL